jgi:pyrimidine operon attenuation protein/uracil phosphoribosyltransferase
MAHEILEQNGGTQGLSLVGIRTRGAYLARRIAGKIDMLSGTDVPVGIVDVTPYRDDHRGEAPAAEPARMEVPVSLDEKTVVLIDDVIYTGRTIRAALDFVDHLGNPKRILVAVFVDRGDRELPIMADIVGKNIQASELERVNLFLQESDGFDQVTVTEDRRRR